MRLIDADALLRDKEDHDRISTHVIYNAPTIDAVPVIRCKDCKHQRKEYHEDKRRKDGGYYVYWCDKVDGYSPLGFDDQYCSEAEREEE